MHDEKLRRIYELQPAASRDTLELLTKSIDEAEAILAATEATIREMLLRFKCSNYGNFFPS